jgi:hypothetical protein
VIERAAHAPRIDAVRTYAGVPTSLERVVARSDSAKQDAAAILSSHKLR